MLLLNIQKHKQIPDQKKYVNQIYGHKQQITMNMRSIIRTDLKKFEKSNLRRNTATVQVRRRCRWCRDGADTATVQVVRRRRRWCGVGGGAIFWWGWRRRGRRWSEEGRSFGVWPSLKLICSLASCNLNLEVWRLERWLKEERMREVENRDSGS